MKILLPLLTILAALPFIAQPSTPVASRPVVFHRAITRQTGCIDHLYCYDCHTKNPCWVD